MPSFRMCPGGHCRMRDQCIRFRAVPDEAQRYFEEAPYSRRDGRCIDFSPVAGNPDVPVQPIHRTYNDEQPGFTEPEREPVLEEEPASVPGAGEEFDTVAVDLGDLGPGTHAVSTPLALLQSMIRDNPQSEPGGSAPRPFDFGVLEPSPGAWMPTTVDLRPSTHPFGRSPWELQEERARYEAERRERNRQMRESFISYNAFNPTSFAGLNIGRPTDRTPPRPTPPPEPDVPPEQMTPEQLASELRRGYSFADRMRQWTRRNNERRQWRNGG